MLSSEPGGMAGREASHKLGRRPESGEPRGSSGGEGVKGGGQVGLEVEKLFQSHQLDGLHHPGVADHQKFSVALIALLGQLHEGSKA